MMKVTETVHHGNYFNERTVAIVKLTSNTMRNLIETSPYANMHVSDERVSQIASELITYGTAEFGWSTFKLELDA